MQILQMSEEGKVEADLTHLDDDSGAGPHVEVVNMSAAGADALSLGKGSGVLAAEALTAPLDRALPVTTLAGVELADGQPDPSAEVNVADPPSRPSLEVAIETLGNLRPRIEALCLRMAGWDKREMGMELRAAFEVTVAKWETSTADLAAGLDLLQSKGFVAKTTVKTRKIAQMKPGTLVVLNSADMVADYSAIYSPEEMAALEVVRTVGSKVFLKTGAREVGLVDVGKVEVRS